MSRHAAISLSTEVLLGASARRHPSRSLQLLTGKAALLFLVWSVAAWPGRADAAILWSDLGTTLVHESGAGADILGGAVKRDDSASDTLYFKFHVDPRSDWSTEEYFAGFQLYEAEVERLGVGNSQAAWAYSAFRTAEIGPSNKVSGDFDLHSSRPEPSAPHAFLPYELPRRGIENTIVFKVQYVPGTDDVVTVWLNPDLAPGATEAGQLESRTTTFKANACFNEIHLRHGGGGEGWTFSDMAIATAFSDLISNPEHASGGGRGALPLTFRSWQREQGLTQNSVRALTQTRDGYLWIGSDDGVARFDGVRFAAFGLREGLGSGRVRVLFEDSRRALWIGTAGGGLTRWADGQFATFTMSNGLPSDSITALAEDAEKRIWVGTESGLVSWQNGTATGLNGAGILNSRPIRTLFRDSHGTMWVGAAGSGIFRFLDGKFAPFVDPAVEGLLQDPHCLLVDKAGRVWVGAGDDFVLCREGEEWRRYRISRHLARPYVSALVEEPDGTVWAGSVSEGLFQFRAGKLAAVNASSGLSDNSVQSLLADREGNLWVGTDAGLNRLRRSNLSAFGQSDGLGYGAVQGLAESAPGVVLAGMPSDGLYRWEGKGFTRLAVADSSRHYPEVNSLVVARDGNCWVGTAHGLLQFKNAPTPGEPKLAALGGLNVISLVEDREGGIWAGTREGELWRLRNGAWLAQSNQWHSHPVTSIVQARDGSMWLGTEGAGLYQFKDQAWARSEKGAGVLSDLIRALYSDAQGALWIGMAGGGLGRWQHGRITTFTTREGLPDNTISQILEDDSGRLWLGTDRGIACVKKDELEQLAAGKISKLYPQAYGRSEGMLSEECTGGYCPAGLKTQSGLLWFSTMKGIVVVDPRPHKTDAPAPEVMLEETMVDGSVVEMSGRGEEVSRKVGKRVSENEISALVPSGSPTHPLTHSPTDTTGIRIAPGKHRVEFHYTGLSFGAPERVRFRYRLDGLDPEWVEADTRRTAFYGYVPPGQYHFHVTACNSDGVWNEAGASLALTVLPHFWQTWWFMGLAALGVLVSVGGGVRMVEKRKHYDRLKHLEQERALERERARIARDLHDDLGSSLARISLLSGLARADRNNPAQLETHVTKISQSADDTVRALEEIVWAVRPGSDSLQSLVEYIAHFANELFEHAATRCRLDLPHDLPARPLPPEVRHDIFLIVKEALTNVLKHARAGEVRVQAKVSADVLEILVQDDGQSFNAETPFTEGTRHGLGNMRRRAEAMGATLIVQSMPSKGSSVRLTVTLAVPAEK